MIPCYHALCIRMLPTDVTLLLRVAYISSALLVSDGRDEQLL